MYTLVILAVTNAQVDVWNSEIQQRNTNESFSLTSHDVFADTFDPHGHLAEVLTGSFEIAFRVSVLIPGLAT